MRHILKVKKEYLIKNFSELLYLFCAMKVDKSRSVQVTLVVVSVSVSENDCTVRTASSYV